MSDRIPQAVLARWQNFADALVQPATTGLINATFFVGSAGGPKAVVQRLHRIFDTNVIRDIEAVTRHLADAGMTTPRLIPADDGASCVEYQGEIWRALTYVPGQTCEFVNDPSQLREAGRLVARFHGALADFDYEHTYNRIGVHDTASHLDSLRTALEEHGSHPLFNRVATLASELLRHADDLPDLTHLPLRQSHGDLKISNVLFNAEGKAVCLIDLDTLSHMIWPFEMGDALRSWCNPMSEDEPRARFDLTAMAAALTGYSEMMPAFLTEAEKIALVPGVIQITLELTARFLADSLRESYFSWDPASYGSRGGHNIVRAGAMWNLYQSVRELQAEAQDLVHTHLG